LKRAQIHALKVPVGLMRHNGKRSDGSTILSCQTHMQKHMWHSARQVGAAANVAANNKMTKYDTGPMCFI